MEKDIEIKTTENIQLESELNFKKNELMNIALNIINKNEFLEKLKNKIRLIQKKNSDEINNDDFLQLLNLINDNIDLHGDRESFNLYVSELNSDFYFRLKNKYPNLTDNEKKLCALLRLKLTSKQISSLLNISPKSVEVNRYRLRQKIGISHNERLTDVINKL